MCMSLAVLHMCMFHSPPPPGMFHSTIPKIPPPFPPQIVPHNWHAARCPKNTTNMHFFYLGRRFGASPNPLWLPKTPLGHLPYRTPTAQKLKRMANPAIFSTGKWYCRIL